MIIFRYLAREALISTAAVTSVLLLIITSARLIKYLADAATGKLEAGFVFWVLLWRIPGFLELLLPLGLFLGILLAFGRLYLDSEMVVLRACGISQKRLAMYALGPAALVAGLVAVMTLWLAPLGAAKSEEIFRIQESRSELELLTPGRFQSQTNGRQVTYAESYDADSDQLLEVFIAQRNENGEPIVLTAAYAERQMVPEYAGRFLVLQDGYRYDGVPGQAAYSRTQYAGYGISLPEAELAREVTELDALPTLQLLSSDDQAQQARLHWRLSLPVLAFIVTLIAVPMSRTNPRQGRFAKLIPSIVVYLLYLSLLTSTRSAVEDGEQSVWLLWVIHALFLVLAANLILAERFWGRLWHRVPSLPKLRRRSA
ncbi:MAG: LPS export ABC transporter permease LptF [Oceanospirillales bacterium]|uniref:Lipopolysaccharide export system permease protein LptF n=1 Tax=Marinobacterium halophilum TaxID=267374 RepID=A0A2P8ESU5_9GAMM|nr:LPS export ABC transporter permease LptF [Marinobacterium halophilum]MBR9829755.1 LPS export ABC transporter permease LptF [Oceanospirillales bacterium]PSL12557.1 lipopolysaccharide export system permease protein [Marinobacterium halophilum]